MTKVIGLMVATMAVMSVSILPAFAQEEEPPPASISNLSAKTSDWSAEVSWTFTGEPSDIYVDDMYLQRLDDNDEVVRSWRVYSDFEGGEESHWSHRVFGLESASAYKFHVLLETEEHDDIYSDVFSVTTQTDPPVAPLGPSAGASHDWVRLTWGIPAQPDWVDNAVIQVTRKRGDSHYGKVIYRADWVEGKETYHYTDSDVKANQQYNYQIRMYAGERWYESREYRIKTKNKIVGDTDATRASATALNAPINGKLYRTERDNLNRDNGDAVDYYSITVTERSWFLFDVKRHQGEHDISLTDGVTAEDDQGDSVFDNLSVCDASDIGSVEKRGVVHIRVKPGTYYVKVEAPADGSMDYTAWYSLRTDTNRPPRFVDSDAYQLQFEISATTTDTDNDDYPIGEIVGKLEFVDDDEGDIVTLEPNLGVAYDRLGVAGLQHDDDIIINDDGEIVVMRELSYEDMRRYELYLYAHDGCDGSGIAAHVHVADIVNDPDSSWTNAIVIDDDLTPDDGKVTLTGTLNNYDDFTDWYKYTLTERYPTNTNVWSGIYEPFNVSYFYEWYGVPDEDYLGDMWENHRDGYYSRVLGDPGTYYIKVTSYPVVPAGMNSAGYMVPREQANYQISVELGPPNGVSSHDGPPTATATSFTTHWESDGIYASYHEIEYGERGSTTSTIMRVEEGATTPPSHYNQFTTTIDGLTPNTTYWYRMRAVNGVGPSKWSNWRTDPYGYYITTLESDD